MKEYLYTGPLTSATLRSGKGKASTARELTLVPGKMVKLDPSERFTRRLLAKGYLELPRAAAPAPAAPAAPAAPEEPVNPPGSPDEDKSKGNKGNRK